MRDICSNCFLEAVNKQGICTACGNDCKKNGEAHPLALPAGSILYGRYIVGKVLGQGGFGITYLAQDYQTKNLVAIKEFFPDTMATRTGRTTVLPFTGDRSEHFLYGKNTFLNEAKTMAEFIGQDNVVQVYSYFEENNTAYFVMEYVEGQNLQEYVKQNYGRISWGDILRLMLPVMDALSLMHEKGIIHRDVTPDNIYIKKDGTVKLLDFGAARHSLGNVSRSLDVVLKHGFAPKEQYHRHGRQGFYTDVYSVAATIYYALTGTKPDDAIERLDEDNLPLPSTLGARITIAQEDALLKGMAIKAEDRYQTMREFSEALLAQTPVNPKPDPVPVPDPVDPKPVNIEISEEAIISKTEEHVEAVPIHEEKPVSIEETLSEVNPVSEEKEEETKSQEHVAVIAFDVPKSTPVPLEDIPQEVHEEQDVLADESISTSDSKKKFGRNAAICAILLLCAGIGYWLFHPHSYGEWKTVKSATCTENGQRERICFCGHTEKESLAQLQHTAVLDAMVEATCFQTGLSEGTHCADCGTVLIAQQEIPKTEHEIIQLAAVPAGCEATGLTEGSGCANCSYVEVAQQEIAALGHSPAKTAAVAATCAREGKTEGSSCSVCGTVLVAQQSIAKLDHTPVKDYAVAATCTTDGKTEGSHCYVCGTVLQAQKSTGKAAHKEVKDPAVAATCQSTGKTEGSHCSVCGTVIVAQKTTSKTGHTAMTDPAVDATCTEPGKTEGSHCSVCGTVIKAQSNTGSALGHSFSENKCTRCNTQEWYAVVTPQQGTYSAGSTVYVDGSVYSNNPSASSVACYIVAYGEYTDGSTQSDQLNFSASNGYSDTYYITVNKPGTVYFSIYTEDGYYLGGCSITVV